VTESHDGALSFGSAAAVYETGRPEYPVSAVEWLLEPVAGAVTRVLDVGAGTGKLTRAIAAVASRVVAVEPDSAMLAQLEVSVPGVKTVVGAAEALPIGDGEFDAALMGQAWHWVKPVESSREIGRVLRPGGVLGLIWNLRDDTHPVIRRLHAVMPEGKATEMLRVTNSPPVTQPFGHLEARQWQWTRSVTRSQLGDMVRSRSFYLTATPEQQATTDRELDQLCDDLNLFGGSAIDLPYVTKAFRGLRH
jgi:SAM-dependent methyltransferase